MIEWGHTAAEAGITVLGVALTGMVTSWFGRRADKKDRDAHQARTEYLLQEYGFHDHNEDCEGATPSTVLTVGGVRRPRVDGVKGGK